ncbi:sec-independent protein translocase protein TatB [Acinetobacter marinus]|uniref:Sec-independent protein translocase protein TatB n=1 Tax=Acinetobacter marinus TaxID=281375 RepID=A0A1G6HJ97_9GAMM|nr:Sec-independent protein translocase protein TatB [Acinetobacter marinus]SDB94330.1 sec-independent protein translocase protein TatB [Acinetobacter marinus]
MFDIGFSELLLLGAIALIVLGPEKLPTAMRALGCFYAKSKRLVSDIQHSIDQELKLDELRQQMQQELEHIKQTEQRMREELQKMSLDMEQLKARKAQSSPPISNSAISNNTISNSSTSSPTAQDTFLDITQNIVMPKQEELS